VLRPDLFSSTEQGSIAREGWQVAPAIAPNPGRGFFSEKLFEPLFFNGSCWAGMGALRVERDKGGRRGR
jgi:hypothetical protein